MGSRATQPPQDFQKMCKQAERDYESKKLAVLIERVKRQLAERQKGARSDPSRKPSLPVFVPSRTAVFER
jgi:hypothetical protein